MGIARVRVSTAKALLVNGSPPPLCDPFSSSVLCLLCRVVFFNKYCVRWCAAVLASVFFFPTCFDIFKHLSSPILAHFILPPPHLLGHRTDCPALLNARTGQFGRPVCSRPRLRDRPKKMDNHLCVASVFLFVAPRAGSSKSSGLLMCLPLSLWSTG